MDKIVGNIVVNGVISNLYSIPDFMDDGIVTTPLETKIKNRLKELSDDYCMKMFKKLRKHKDYCYNTHQMLKKFECFLDNYERKEKIKKITKRINERKEKR